MDVLALLKVMLRRWYVVAPILVVTLAGAFVLQQRSEPEYETSGVLMLSNTSARTGATDDRGLDVQAIAEAVQSELAFEAGGSGSTIVTANEGFVGVTTTSHDPQVAQNTVATALDELIARVEGAQAVAEVPEDERIRARATSPEIPIEQGPFLAGGDTGFRATGTLELRDPLQETGNPYAANAATGRLLEIVLESDDVRLSIYEKGSRSAYDISQQARDSIPAIFVETIGSEPSDVIGTFGAVTTAMRDELNARQDAAGVPDGARVTIEVLAPPTAVNDVSPPIERAAAAAVGLGGILALCAAIIAESVAGRRKGLPGQPDTAPGSNAPGSHTTSSPVGARPLSVQVHRSVDLDLIRVPEDPTG